MGVRGKQLHCTVCVCVCVCAQFVAHISVCWNLLPSGGSLKVQAPLDLSMQ